MRVPILKIIHIRIVLIQSLFISTPGNEHLIELNLVLESFDFNQLFCLINALQFTLDDSDVCFV